MTTEALSKEFTSEAWQALKDEESVVCKVLLSSAFKNEEKGQTAAQIDTDYLILFGLLHCQGTPKDKAEKWYDILQEGGKAEHNTISASDKDINTVVKKMVDFVTCDVFGTFAPIAGVENAYSEDELSQFCSNTVETFLEEVLLEDQFGVHSNLEYDAWEKETCEKAAYMFSAHELRAKVLS